MDETTTVKTSGKTSRVSKKVAKTRYNSRRSVTTESERDIKSRRIATRAPSDRSGDDSATSPCPPPSPLRQRNDNNNNNNNNNSSSSKRKAFPTVGRHARPSHNEIGRAGRSQLKANKNATVAARPLRTRQGAIKTPHHRSPVSAHCLPGENQSKAKTNATAVGPNSSKSKANRIRSSPSQKPDLGGKMAKFG